MRPYTFWPGVEALERVFEVMGGDFIAAGSSASRIKNLLKQIGIDSRLVRRASIVAYEAEMNIVIHARKGTVRLIVTPEYIEIIAQDEGPGIPDLELAMQEGYSTASQEVREMGFGAGMGLPNMKRFSDELVIKSEVGVGTEVRALIFIRGPSQPETMEGERR